MMKCPFRIKETTRQKHTYISSNPNNPTEDSKLDKVLEVTEQEYMDCIGEECPFCDTANYREPTCTRIDNE